jgi:heme A synthase
MLPVVLNLHLYNMVLVLATSTITGIWGLILYFRWPKKKTGGEAQGMAATPEKVAAQPKETLNQPWKIALIVTAIDGLLQGLLGVILVLLGQKPGGGSLYYLHYVYGAIVLLAIPVAYTYASKDMRRTVLILSLAALIIAAAGARAMMTGLGIGS